MDLRAAKDIYDMLRRLANDAFDIVFGNENISKDSNVNKETLGTNLDQYLQCVLVKCLIDRNSLNDQYFDIIKHLTDFDCFINIPSISENKENIEDISNYADKVLNNVPLFFKIVIHVDQVCLNDDPSFDTKISRDTFACVVEIVKNIVPYEEVGDIAICLYDCLKPVMNKFKEAKLNYQK